MAAGYPERNVTIVVPYSAGGGVDAIARLLAEKLRDSLKQSVIVDNRPSASGMLGASYTAKAPADGYTLLIGSAGETAINPLVYKARMQYQPARDFAPSWRVTAGESARDGKGRLYSAFDKSTVVAALAPDDTILFDQAEVSESFGKTIHRLIVRRAA
ncbi:Bug family tripartite tricarboxylate transporter substrate binding protein [Sphingomonas sp. NCPPB 2930]